MIIELTQQPIQQQPGQPPQPEQTLLVPICNIGFIFKPSLQPAFLVAIGEAVIPCMGDYEETLKTLSENGLTIFETPEGLQCAVNPVHILFYMTPQLGLYNLMFTGKAAVTVKATGKQIEKLIETKIKPPVILY